MQNPPVSIIIATFNQKSTLQNCVESFANIKYDNVFEILVIDAGSTAKTLEEIYTKLETLSNVKIYRIKHSGGVIARNFGIKSSAYEYCAIFGGDCIVNPQWLSQMMKSFKENMAFVSAYGPHGGNATIYKKRALKDVNFFDVSFNKMGSGYHDDSDVFYKLKKIGYTSKFLESPDVAFKHITTIQNGLYGKLKYSLKRVLIHKLDPLLFKRHPDEFRKDFDVLFAFIINPIKDFKKATGKWNKNGTFSLSSPQGVTLISNRGPISFFLIVLGGVVYVSLLKILRLIYSFRYGRLLI